MTQLSIITINLNNCSGLLRTVESVVSQTFTDFEFIIIDGGSDDGSVALIEKNKHRVDYWISESDAGIYNAMNKGIKVATGEYCLFLNSGDWLAHNDILTQVFMTNLYADIIVGDVIFFDCSQNKIIWEIASPEHLTAKTIFYGLIPHQSSFIKRSLFFKIGFYNEALKIVSDWLFFLEALLEKGATYQHYQGVVSYFNMDGISCNPTTSSLPREEQLSILQNKYPRFITDYEYLERLERESNQWFASREYAVYKIYTKIGLIKLGIWVRRGGNFLKRILPNVFYH